MYVVALSGSVSRITRSAPCTFAISPTRATSGPGGGSGSVVVTAGANCSWTAVSNAPWITVTAGASGSGNGTVTYDVAPYTGKPKNRNGTITIAEQTFSIKQSR